MRAVAVVAVGLLLVLGGGVARACDQAGSELLGFPSLAETPTYPLVLHADLADLEAHREVLRPASEQLEDSKVELFATQPATPAPAVAPKATPRPARPARPARAEGGHGWSYEDADDDDDEVRTDTLVVVRRGMVFTLENFGGSIDLKTWGKNSVRIRAMHGARHWVALSTAKGRLDVSSQARLGVPGAVDYQITMPAWMNARLSGVYNDVTVDGLEGGMTVETVSGDIKAVRVAGEIALRSVQGTVIVEGAKGNLQVSSVNDGVRIVNADGVIAAEAVNGDIQLIDLRSKTVNATTVSGEVIYAGTILDDGDYNFSTHNGDIAISLGDDANATVSVATFSGEFESPYPVRIKKLNKDKRFRFVLGSGAAKLNLESFDGAIQLFRPGAKVFKTYTMSEWIERQKERETERKVERERARAERHKAKYEKKSHGTNHEDEEDEEDDEDNE